jgi:pyruvate dehydrogenase E1 component beta subunit
MDTPISETAFIGAATGAAAAGLRPIVELMFVDFFGVCMDPWFQVRSATRFKDS